MYTIDTCWQLLLVAAIASAYNNTTDRQLSCRKLYNRGVEAYLDNRFDKCIQVLEKAVEKFRDYSKKIQYCRMKCHRDAALAEPLYHTNVDNLLFFEKTIVNTLCILKCKDGDRNVFDEFNLSEDTVDIFESKKPYEYLHICYYQTKQVQKAASAAFTYLIKHPNDEAMMKNLQQYLKLPGFKMDDIVNFEAKDYVYLYVHGSDAYEAKNWDDVIHNMEESLSSYLQSEDECRAQCEGPYNQGWFPDFVPSIANHFTHSLRCKRKCMDNLSTLNGEKHDDLMPSHYHYLQYAYFKKGNLQAASEAAMSYLLFFPMDETMLYNIEYYKTLPKTEGFFKPRLEALYYSDRNKYEENILKFISEQFNVRSEDMEKHCGRYKSMCLKKMEKRLVLDNFISPNDCVALVGAAKTFSLPGDGYTGNISPHTTYEMYEGLTLERAFKLVNYSVMNEQLLKLLLNVSDSVKTTMSSYFHLSKRLHFAFTHLVCRNSIPGSPNNRTDFSHPVHADNCNIQIDGSCPKTSPAYTWRDYTAILYLNDGFSGGELFFSNDYFGKQIEQSIKPSCGKLVGFSSGSENLHGVKAIQQGTRCALALWFTFDHSNSEIGHNSYYPM